MMIEAEIVSQAFESYSLVELLQVVRGLEDGGNNMGAIDAYRIWLSHHANAPMANYVWLDFGRILQKIGNLEKASFAYTAALEQKSDHTEAALALGYLLEVGQKSQEAIEIWRKCIGAGGERRTLLNNIGRVYDNLYQYDLAEQALVESLEIDSRQHDVISTLLYIRQRLCKWPILDLQDPLDSDEVPSYLGPIASLAYFNDPVKNLKSARSTLLSKGLANVKPVTLNKRKRAASQKLKVGFLSADFRLHATSVFFTEILAKLDRALFEVYALDITVNNDPFGNIRQSILSKADHHLPLQALTDEAAVDLIRAQNLDILVDMSGLTAAARPLIVANRVAPVQISYLGYIGSCGMESVDYILTSADMYLEEHRLGYTETPLILPGAYVAIAGDLIDYGNLTASRAQCGLPEDQFVYCALLNSYKITPEVYDSWLNILLHTEGSVLWLLGEQPATIQRLIDYAAAKGVGADRLVFLTGRVHPIQYRAYLRCADIFLDTSPYGNGATAREAILADLPILACPGSTMMSRFSAHLMGQLGMNEFVVDTRHEYEKMAVALGRDPNLMQDYKKRMAIARETSNLFNVDLFVRQFGETLLRAYN